MNHCIAITLSVFLLMLAGCATTKQVCPPITGTPQYLTTSPDRLATPTPVTGPLRVEIGRKTVQVDKIVEGPLCNDTWKGVVFVSCNVQVFPWDEQPTFLKDCELNIESGSIVYVAYHNNAAYYNGCSCHTAINPEP